MAKLLKVVVYGAKWEDARTWADKEGRVVRVHTKRVSQRDINTRHRNLSSPSERKVLKRTFFVEV